MGGLGGVTAGIAGFRNLLARGMWVPGGGRRCWRMSGLIRRRVWPGFLLLIQYLIYYSQQALTSLGNVGGCVVDTAESVARFFCVC